MKFVYISGPITMGGCVTTPWALKQNVLKAEEIARRCMLLGAAVYCPHSHTNFIGPELTHDQYLERDVEVLKRCDAIVFTEGWFQSKGCRQEHKHAQDLGIPSFFAPDLGWFSEWLKKEDRK